MKQAKNYFAAILYRLVLLLVRLLPAQRGNKHLLLIKTDEIGDYILFRNLLQYIRHSEKYKNYKITLLANPAWKDFFESYDTVTVDNIIWLNKKKFKSDIIFRLKFLYSIRKLRTSDIVNCVFSRSILADDGFAFVAKGNNIIAMESDNANKKVKRSVNLDKFIYTEVIKAGDEKIFDSVRNRNFWSSILGQNNLPIDTKINLGSPKHEIDKKYLVLFISAGNPERKWPIQYHVDSAKYAFEKYGLTPVITGGPNDTADADNFMKLYNGNALNFTGKTSLIQLTGLLHFASFLICVDTGALHIAAAVGCPVIGLYSGKFFGRFAPYPQEITSQFFPVYPDFVDELIAKKDPILYDTFTMKNNTMKLIPPEKTFPFIDKIMQPNV